MHYRVRQSQVPGKLHPTSRRIQEHVFHMCVPGMGGRRMGPQISSLLGKEKERDRPGWDVESALNSLSAPAAPLWLGHEIWRVRAIGSGPPTDVPSSRLGIPRISRWHEVRQVGSQKPCFSLVAPAPWNSLLPQSRHLPWWSSGRPLRLRSGSWRKAMLFVVIGSYSCYFVPYYCPRFWVIWGMNYLVWFGEWIIFAFYESS